MDMPARLIGDAVRARRNEMHMTQAKLAEELGIDPRYLQKIELGKSIPSIKTFYRIAHTMNLSMDALFFGTGEPSETRAGLERLLSRCGERELRVLLATAEALLTEADNTTQE